MLLIFIGVCCLFPLSLYFLFLASLHQRPRPTMISGVWDAIALFLGLIGFLLVGGTVLVFSLDRAIREYWLWGGTAREWLALHRQAEWYSKFLWGSYVVMLSILLGWVVHSRWHDTVIYQLTPAELEERLLTAFQRFNRSLECRGAHGWLSLPPSDANKAENMTYSQGAQPLLRIDGSESLRISVIRWLPHGLPFRQDVEAELSRILRAIHRLPSPAAAWFLTATAVIFVTTTMLLGMIVFRIGR